MATASIQKFGILDQIEMIFILKFALTLGLLHIVPVQSTSRKRLSSEEVNLEHIITNALESDLCCKVNITKVSKAWSKVLEEKGESLESDITWSLQKAMAQLKLTQSKEGDSQSDSQPANANSSFAKKAFKSIVQRFKGKDSQGTGDKEMKDKVEAEIPSKEAEARLKRLRRVRIREHPDDTNACIYVWDFGGQKTYYTLHHVFLRATCIYILVVNLSIPLDKPADSLKGLSSTGSQIAEGSGETYVEAIEFWMNTILSHLSKSGHKSDISNVFVVGTHKDLLHPDKEEQEKLAQDYFRRLRSMLQSKQHKNLIRMYFAVDSKGGDPETYGKLREALVDAIKVYCHWGEKRPIKWLCLERKLHEIQMDSSIPENERNLVKFQDVMKYASDYKLETDEDVKVFLEFSHLCGDLTYFNTPELKDFVIPSPQWLINVFRAVITLDNFYPDDPRLDTDICCLKQEGMLKRNSPLLAVLWKEFLPSGEDVLHDDVISFLLHLMVEFDLMVKHAEDRFLVPSLLPLCPSKTESLFPSMVHAAPALYFRFHSSQQSFQEFQEGSNTYDQFMPLGVFPRLISRLVKTGWKWTEHKYQDFVSYTSENCVIVLTSQSTWIKIEVCVPDTHVAVELSKCRHNIATEINTIISAYIPNMWFEYCLNPCGTEGPGCIVATGASSLGGTEHLVRCPEHNRCFKILQFNMWFSAERCRILTEKDLMTLAQELTDEWKRLQLATELEVEISDLQAAEADNPQTRLASFEMLLTWFNSQVYKTDAYLTLCSALKNAGLAGLINKCLGDY